MKAVIRQQNHRNTAIEAMQSAITREKDINDRFAQKLIDWYFSKYPLTWKTFLEAKRIAQITNNESFVSTVFRSRMKNSAIGAESHCS